MKERRDKISDLSWPKVKSLCYLQVNLYNANIYAFNVLLYDSKTHSLISFLCPAAFALLYENYSKAEKSIRG